MKYAVEMGSGVMIYVYAKFHRDWFRHSKINVRDTHTNTHTYGQEGYLIFFLNKESRLKIGVTSR
jgi:hypothetical protein